MCPVGGRNDGLGHRHLRLAETREADGRSVEPTSNVARRFAWRTRSTLGGVPDPDEHRDLGPALDGPVWRQLRGRFESGRHRGPIELSAAEAELITTALAELRLLVVGSLDVLDESALSHSPTGAQIEAGLQDAAAILRHLATSAPRKRP